MLTDKFRTALEQYHRKKWFPDTYPDPFGEFIDYVSEGMVSDLVASWKRTRRGSEIDAAYYLMQILPQIRYRDILMDFGKAFSTPVFSDIRAEFVFYFVRSLPEQQSLSLWNHFKHWNEKWETALSEWNHALLEFEASHVDLLQASRERFAVQSEEMTVIESDLRGTKELFAWRLEKETGAGTYQHMLQAFRFERWISIADWKDFPALAKSVTEACKLTKVPELQRSENDAAQFVFPVAPPNRVVVEYGSATGPFDALRFLLDYGKGLFYAGMNPDLEAEERICGDPALPWFWANIFASIFAENAGIKHFLGLQAEGFERFVELAIQAWNRHEAALYLYRKSALGDWKNLQDRYADCWDLMLPMEPPRFLYLYDLTRSGESLFKTLAAHSAQNAIQIFRTKYGSRWFASSAWSKRVKEYFWEGFRLTLHDLMKSL